MVYLVSNSAAPHGSAELYDALFSPNNIEEVIVNKWEFCFGKTLCLRKIDVTIKKYYHGQITMRIRKT